MFRHLINGAFLLLSVGGGKSLTAQLRLGPADILESDENGIIPEQDRVITQVVILDADKKQIQCVVRPLQILRADGTWENIGGMK
ncbi:phage tail fiber C-terminal domain-containing protein [Escherichia coli]|uniref:phage tail fiber C-terminal domain-containing protein n=1 Tax=Escherichia coli TaxID=562 RepID=UPI00201CE7ED|nr:phage tail fiber C-terminal domain-containing protein [Escherichia coli]